MLNHNCYHKVTILNNGKKVNIRFLKKQDRDDLITFFQQTPQEDLQFCKEDVKNAKTVDSWLALENSHRNITLVAENLESKLPVAFVNLYCGQKAAMNVGEIQQILVIRPFQGQGLGSRMLDELIPLAAKKQLCWLKAEVVADMKPLIQAFKLKGCCQWVQGRASAEKSDYQEEKKFSDSFHVVYRTILNFYDRGAIRNAVTVTNIL